jgi:photosystem II stability/assembly factor-like uncharacterized protein
MKKSKLLGFILVARIVAVQSVFAQTWMQTSAPTNQNWHSVACSADGTKLVAVSDSYNFGAGNNFSLDGSIYLSTDSGTTWTPANAPIAGWISVCSSADGSRLAAIPAGGPIYTSTDAGATWEPRDTPSQFLDCIACSAVGNKLTSGAWDDFVGQRSSIYTSWTFGRRWMTSFAPTEYWTSVACSSDGNNLVAASVNPSDTGGIYISKNSGMTWRRTTAPAGNWYAVASSANGKKLAAAISGGPIYLSTNSGASWSEQNVPDEPWTSLVFSADGNKLVAVSNYGGPIYMTDDCGATWTQADAPLNSWLSVASSADGNKLVAVTFNDGIYTVQTTPTPQLNYCRTWEPVTIFWIIPSEFFVLQRSADNIHWSNVSKQPVLNLSRLIYEISLPRTRANTFFRLVAL